MLLHTSANYRTNCGDNFVNGMNNMFVVRPRVKEPKPANVIGQLPTTVLSRHIGRFYGRPADPQPMSDELCIENAAGSRKYSEQLRRSHQRDSEDALHHLA
ncbi:hypothetical protein GTR04_4404 [Trichophyton interdigitale]|uniref:Uncharacterized protein n=3 Tax=Trichophyton TaxID=5550 RepID=A0A9P4YGA0_9EURO|nr:hypothetical protein TEQG_08250 [Trichophyton equinum CBS 127.97]EZF32960.1 hypothetical protein H101_03451 [Trichophyton interdigitale H6]KAF3893830.1 hypothetical protein GY632_4037 [Trichophyton interdigitale]KDB21106.1 hypothetical protein H109_06950 [Trichophyton interdigitale MR816]KAG5210031.1 hypothetical protein GY631_5210 [Trichophyton interdigitale]